MPAQAPPKETSRPKGHVTYEGAIAGLNAAQAILQKHTQYFEPKLQTALKDRVEYIIPKLKIKTESPEQLSHISTQVAQGTTAQIFTNIGRVQETEQIPQIIADSIATTIDADPRLQTDKIDKEKIYKRAEKSAEEISETHAQDLENSAVLGDIDNMRSLGGPNPQAQAEVEYQIDNYIAETQGDDSQVSKNALMGNVAGFTQNYLGNISKNLSTELTQEKIPTLARLQEIKSHSFELAAAELAQNTGRTEPVQAAQKVGVALSLTTPTLDHMETVGLGTTQPNPLTFANAVGNESADVGIQLANRDGYQKKTYLFLLASHPKFETRLQKEAEKSHQLSSQPATYQNIIAQRHQKALVKILQAAKIEAQKNPQEKQKITRFFNRFQGGLPRASRHVWTVTTTYFDRTPAFYVPQSLVTERVLYSRAIGSMPVVFNIPNTNSGASSIMRLPGLIRGTKSFKAARSAIGAAKAAGTAARVGATAAETTNPVGWALLAAQFAPAIQKLLKKAAMAVGALIAYLIFMFGLKFIGAAAGFIFGAVTGSPLLLLGPPGWIAYAGWTGFWTYYGWSHPLEMLNITLHPLAALSNVLHSVTNFVSNAFGAVSNAGSAVGSVFTGGTPAGAVVAPAAGATIGAAIGFLVGGPIGAAIGAGIGYLLTGGFGHLKNLISFTTGASPAAVGGFFGAAGSFLTGTAATVWGGLSSAGGAALGFLGNVGGAIFGGLGSTSTAGLAALSVGGAFTIPAAITIFVGIPIAATFFNPEPGDDQFAPGIAENQFFTLEKTAIPGEITELDLLNIGSPQPIINFTIKIEAKDQDLDNIIFEDVLNVRGENPIENRTIDLEIECQADPPPRQLAAHTSWSCEFTVPVVAGWLNTFAINTITVTAYPPIPAPIITGSTSASVKIGNPPANCPSGWPTEHGSITQGPEGSTTHGPDNWEAIDIGQPGGTAVYATLNGTIQYPPPPRGNRPDNQVIQIIPYGCPGLDVVEYVHLADRSVSPGDEVILGQPLGTISFSEIHVHYQFNYSGRSFPLVDPYVPLPPDFNRACDNSHTPCNVSW